MGENRIIIKGFQEGNDNAIEEKILTIFLRSNLYIDYSKTPPGGFKEYTFHTPENEKTAVYAMLKD